MSKRVTKSIINNIEKLTAKILKYQNDIAEKQAEIQAKYDAKINPLREKIEKFEAMLGLLNSEGSVDKEKAEEK